MTNYYDNDEDEFDEPVDRRSEGVRIIGAQEAASAAERPDVVRRRRRRGNDVESPGPAASAPDDLPRITISTTETDQRAAGSPSGSPAAQPAGDPAAEPQWRTDDRRAGGPSSYGHARVLDETSGPGESEDPPLGSGSDDDDPDPGSVSVWDDTWADEPAPASDPVGPDPVDRQDDPATSWSAADPEQDDEPYSTSFDAASGDDVGQPSSESGSSIWDPEPLPWEPQAMGSAAVPGWGEAAQDVAGPDAGPAEEAFDDDDDSFVLPHWTEPPTGQVPKVVIDEAPDADNLASYGSQPRWRDEGERSSLADFDDLVDDSPGLGALATHALDDHDEDHEFFTGSVPTSADDVDEAHSGDDYYYDDDYYDDEYDDEYDDAAPRARRGRSNERQRSVRSGDDGGTGERNLPVAIGVGLALVGIGLFCFWAGPLPTALLATVVVTFCATEYFSAVRSAGHNPASLLGVVAVAGLMLATFATGLAAYPVVFGLVVITGLLWFLWVAPGEGAVANLGLTLLGVLWVGFLGSFATLFLGLGRTVEAASVEITSNLGIGVLIAAVIASVTHDVGAYFTGKYLGRTPLSAASPNKTQEGLAGGVTVSIVATFVIVGVFGVSPIGDSLAQAFIFAVLCALVAPLGDLSESFIKRDLGIKDMGSLLPGHGGVLDRFDALLFVLPTAYFVTVLFEIWTVGAG